MKIIVNGKLPQGVTSKDLALYVIGDLKADGGLYMSVEWHGKAIEALSLSQRATLANITAEMGAKNSYLLPDQKVNSHLKHRAKRSFEPVFPDPDARYARVVEYDASKIEPMIACPHAVDNVKPLSELVGKHIDQAFLGTCTNGRLEDLADAAAILRGRRIYNLVKFVLPFKGHFLVSVCTRNRLNVTHISFQGRAAAANRDRTRIGARTGTDRDG